mmetsp:Transcript_23178/g.48090  ORF Transcript_23178/g.48090 Transcript_23178/m.48090 type:complete len:259 (-) Transcript_23178:572-1348(-)
MLNDSDGSVKLVDGRVEGRLEVGGGGNGVQGLELTRSLEECGSRALPLLQLCARREVTSPETVLAVRVREEIVGFDLPLKVVLVLCERVNLRVGVDEFDGPEPVVRVGLDLSLCGVLVNVLYNGVQITEPDLRVLVLKVAPHGHHDVRSPSLVSLLIRGADKVCNLAVDVVILEIRIVHHWLVRAEVIKTESTGRTVVASIGTRESPENLRLILARSRCPPNTFDPLLVPPQLQILIVDPSEIQSIKTSLGTQQTSLS